MSDDEKKENGGFSGLSSLVSDVSNEDESSDTPPADKSELTLTINRSFIPEREKRELKIGFADYEWGKVGEVICRVIRKGIGDKYEIKDRWSYYGDELLKFAQTGAVDIFILNLNCIDIFEENLGLRGRLEYSYQIISQIKTNCSTPIIAYSGWSKQAARAESAGVDFYLDMPFKVEDIMPAFEECLKMLSESDSHNL